jgi:acyl carrier protein
VRPLQVGLGAVPFDGGVESALRRLLAAELQLSVAQLQGSMPVSELGLDSLAFVEMVVAIERDTGRDIDVDLLPPAISPDVTVDEMLAVVVAAFDGPLQRPASRR